MPNVDAISEANAVWDLEGAKLSGLVSDGVLKRRWTLINDTYLQELVAVLRKRASLKNPDDGRHYYAVRDPLVNNIKVEGFWRNALVEADTQPKAPVTITQTLREGYLETLLDAAGNVDFSEARIRQGRFLQDQPTGGNPSDDEKYLEVFWPNCSVTKLKTMADQLSASTFVNPTIEGEVQTGTWRNNLVLPTTADDGSKIITMFLGIAHFRLDGFSNWLTHNAETIAYLYGYSKDEAQAISEAWKAKGRSARFSYDKSTGLVDITLGATSGDMLTISAATESWNCRYKNVVDAYYSVSDPELYPLTTTPTNGLSYDRQVRDNGDGTWDIFTTTRNVQYRDFPFQATRISAGSEVQIRQQLGLTTQTAEPVVETDGAILSQRIQVIDDCSKDVVTEKETITNQSAISYNYDHFAHRTETENTAATSALTEPTPAAGEIIARDNRPTEFPGRTATREITDTAQAIVIAPYRLRHIQGSESWVKEYIQSATPPALASPDGPDNSYLAESGWFDGMGGYEERSLLSFGLDRYLRYNWKELRTRLTFPFEGEKSYSVYGDIEYVTSQVFSATIGRYWNDRTYVYRRKTTFTAQYFRTMDLAIAWLASVITENWEGSGISQTGPYEYVARKAVHTKELLTTYDYLEPTQ